MRRATRLFTLAAAGVFAVSAIAAQACEREKSATAAACNTKSCPASACAAHATTTAKNATVTKKKSPAVRNASASAAAKKAPASASMRIYRDPETGTLGVDPQVKAIGTDGVVDLKETPVTLTEVALPNGGGYMIDLQGTGQDYATMQIDAKGNRKVTCAPARTGKSVKVAPATTNFPEK